MKVIKTIIIAAAFVCSGAVGAFAAVDHKALAIKAYDKHVIPGYQLLEKETGKLKARFEAYCKEPGVERIQSVREAFKSALLAWSRVEHIRFGPVATKYRYERFAFWPDIKSRGLRQVRRVLANRDETVLKPERLAKKSVALQGFTALEFLLYGTGYEAITVKSDDGLFRCSYGGAIAANLLLMSKEVLAGWDRKGAYADAFLNPADGKVFHTAPEVTLALFQAYETGYARARRLKVLGPLGGVDMKKLRPKKAPYWRSGLTTEVISANLSGTTSLFLEGGFSDMITEVRPKLRRSAELASGNGLRLLKSIRGPIETILEDKSKRTRFRFIATVFGVLRGQTGEAIVEAAELTIGFNADDGD